MKMMMHASRKLIAVLVAIIAVASTIFAVAVYADDLDLSRDCSLTIKAGDFTQLPELDPAAPVPIDVVFDIYKIADVVLDGSTYDYDLSTTNEVYQHTTLPVQNTLTPEGWITVEKEIGKMVLVDPNGITPDYTAVANNVKLDLATPGLYMIVARNASVTDKAKYVSMAADGSISSSVYAQEYEYSFPVELLAVPNFMNGDVVSNEWQYDMVAALKPEKLYRTGDLVINKTLKTFDSNPENEALFIFDIEATKVNELGEEELVYSNVISKRFSAAGTESIVLEGVIPVGAKVTVTEVYSGAGYKLVAGSPASQDVIIAPVGASAEDVAKVSFTNDFANTPVYGKGVDNHFTYDGSEWTWNKQ